MALLSYLLVLLVFVVLAMAPLPIRGGGYQPIRRSPAPPTGHAVAPPCGRCWRCLERNARSPPSRR